jgi:hypothetical protein
VYLFVNMAKNLLMVFLVLAFMVVLTVVLVLLRQPSHMPALSPIQVTRTVQPLLGGARLIAR